MTDFDAALARRSYKSLATVIVFGMLGLGVAGCETASSIFGDGASASSDVQSAASAAAAAKAPVARVALAPVVGAPDGIAKQLAAQFTQAAEKNRLSITSSDEAKPDYTLRGYIVAARDKAGTKVSYIWDVADPNGKRVNRIAGEELVPGTPNAKDPWSNVSASATQAIVDKTAASLGAWAASQPSAAAQSAATPVAAAPPTPAMHPSAPPAAAGAGAIEPQQVRSPQQQAATAPAQSTNTTTAALPRSDEIAAVVPAVAGAPGDGNTALSAALQRELSRQGIALVDKPGASYRVEGKVVMGQAKDGKQPIQIDWRVKDPQGKPLGTVSQKNEIPPGSLDSSWGQTADAAAAAAAQGIVKLLPQPRSTN